MKDQEELSFPDPDNRELHFIAMRATQPIGDLYITVMDAKDLCLIANFDVRRVLQEERDVERYLGIQRPLNQQRVYELEKYVNFSDATFPTSVIIAIEDDYASFDEVERRLIVRNFREGEDKPSTNIRRIARVIDGQHRIAGLFDFKGASFQMSVTVFVGSDISDQAYVFATVNLEQTKVSRSLTYDLFALAKTRSPQRTCHNVAVALDSDPQGPFFRKIKRLGVATPGRTGEMLTQAAFVESLLPYISRDAKSDRDTLLRGRTLERTGANDLNRLIFRDMFIEGQDLDIANVIFNYFSAVKNRWPEGWNSQTRGLILNRTSGFKAFMRVLGPLYIRLGSPGDVVKTSAFESELARIDVDTDHFSTENYPPGSTGEGALRRDLLSWLGLDSAGREILSGRS